MWCTEGAQDWTVTGLCFSTWSMFRCPSGCILINPVWAKISCEKCMCLSLVLRTEPGALCMLIVFVDYLSPWGEFRHLIYTGVLLTVVSHQKSTAPLLSQDSENYLRCSSYQIHHPDKVKTGLMMSLTAHRRDRHSTTNGAIWVKARPASLRAQGDAWLHLSSIC